MEGGEPDLWRGSESRAKEMALFAGDDVVLVLQLRARKEACDALASFAVSQQINKNAGMDARVWLVPPRGPRSQHAAAIQHSTQKLGPRLGHC